MRRDVRQRSCLCIATEGQQFARTLCFNQRVNPVTVRTDRDVVRREGRRRCVGQVARLGIDREESESARSGRRIEMLPVGTDTDEPSRKPRDTVDSPDQSLLIGHRHSRFVRQRDIPAVVVDDVFINKQLPGRMNQNVIVARVVIRRVDDRHAVRAATDRTAGSDRSNRQRRAIVERDVAAFRLCAERPDSRLKPVRLVADPRHRRNEQPRRRHVHVTVAAVDNSTGCRQQVDLSRRRNAAQCDVVRSPHLHGTTAAINQRAVTHRDRAAAHEEPVRPHSHVAAG